MSRSRRPGGRPHRCIVFIYPDGFKSEMAATLRESSLYEELLGTPETKEKP